ncbi:DUF7558 family protein [Haloplanus aerogenes]
MRRVGDAFIAHTRFRVEPGHPEGPVQVCDRCILCIGGVLDARS